MKAPRQSVRLRRLPIAPRIGALWYLLLLLACTIFTQALRSPLSAVVLNFVLLLPIADLICLAISWFFVSVTIEGSDRIIERGEPLAVPMSITNRGILPLSCVEVMFSIPLPYALHSQAVAKRVAIPPVSAVTTKVALELRRIQDPLFRAFSLRFSSSCPYSQKNPSLCSNPSPTQAVDRDRCLASLFGQRKFPS